MKKTSTTLSTGLFVLAILLLLANSSGAPAGNTGAPDEQTCGRAGCHGVPVNQGDATIEINFADGADTYTAGETHTVAVSIIDPQSAAKNGFQIVALDSANNNIGEWKLTNEDATQLANGSGSLSGRRYVTHTFSGNSLSEWTMDWQAPEDAAAGSVTFYLAVNDANNNGTNSGDAIYTTDLTIEPATVSSVQNALAETIKILANPVAEKLRLQSEGNSIHTYSILDFSGRLLQTAAYQPEIDITELENGIYLLLLKTEKGRVAKKFVVQ